MPVKTVYLPIIFGNLNPDNDILLNSIEIFDKDKNLILEKKVNIFLRKIYEFAKSPDEIRKSLGINPPTAEDLDKAKEILLEIDATIDKVKRICWLRKPGRSLNINQAIKSQILIQSQSKIVKLALYKID